MGNGSARGILDPREPCVNPFAPARVLPTGYKKSRAIAMVRSNRISGE
jgi:hypothetical protein